MTLNFWFWSSRLLQLQESCTILALWSAGDQNTGASSMLSEPSTNWAKSPTLSYVFKLTHIQLSKASLRWAQMFPYYKTKIRNTLVQPAPHSPLSFAPCCPQKPGLSILSICLAPAIYQRWPVLHTDYLKRKEKKETVRVPPSPQI